MIAISDWYDFRPCVAKPDIKCRFGFRAEFHLYDLR